MKNTHLSILAIFISLTALGVTFALRKSPSSKEVDAVGISELTARLDRLESRLAGRSATDGVSSSGSSVVARTRPSADSDLVAELQARQNHLEEQLKEYGILERFAEHKRLVEESYGIALDANRSAKERLEALNLLHDEGRIDAAVVGSMMDLWDQSMQNEKLGPYHRWALMENLRGSTDPRFRDEILSMLSEEPGAKMTGQAISALEPMLPDPAVEEWLVHLSSSSPEPKIQEYATSVLQRRGVPNK
jgi:hypothetical protein